MRTAMMLAGACAMLTGCGQNSAPAGSGAGRNAAAEATRPARPATPAAPEAPADSVYFGRRDVPARTSGAIRIATYNLLNLFDDIDDPTLSGELEDIDDAKPAEQREAVARAIALLDADVLALQEIESESALREFRDRYLAEMGYEHLVSVDTGDPRGIECAVLSRFPVSNVEHWAGLELGGEHPEMWGNQPNDWAGQPITFKRSPLRVDVAVAANGGGDPYTLTLFVLHNKSGGPGGYWREAESRKIVELMGVVRQENPEANIVVLGDLNAQRTDQSVRTLLDAGLTEVCPLDPQRVNETTSHESGRRIDHILLSPAALGELVEGSGFILGTPSRAPGADWRTTPAAPGTASDHFPVAVELWIGDR